MPGPLVSIVTPCYNGESFLSRYFNGILSQTYRDVELIFVDDGSTDGTEAMFRSVEGLLKKKLRGQVLYVRQENRGPAAAVNTGYQLATGDLLAPCDSDDVILPSKVNDHVVMFAKDQDYGLVFGDYILCDEKGVPRGGPGLAHWSTVPEGFDVYEALLEHGMFIKAGAYCFRSDCLNVLPEGQLDCSDPGQNLDFLLRVSHRYRVGFHNAPVVKIFERSDSVTRRTSRRAVRHVLRSKKLVKRVINELGCAPDVERAMERRYLLSEMRCHLILRHSEKVRDCFYRAVRLRKVNKKTLVWYLSSICPYIMNMYVKHAYPEYFQYRRRGSGQGAQ